MTRDEAATFVLDRLQIPSSDSAKITQVQNLLQLEVDRANVLYELTLTTATVTVDNTGASTNLPSDVQRIKTLLQGTVTIDITDEVTWAQRLAAIAAGTWTTVTNPPTFAIWRPPSTLLFRPAPSANTSVTLVYVQRPGALSGATQLPLPLEWHDLMAERVVRRMALTEGEPAIAQIALDIARELEAELMGLRNMQAGPDSWQIPMQGYPS